MTEQERPRTEAGRRDDFVRAAEERIHAAGQSGEGFMATAIRVELLTMWAAARDEGRQQAVREAREQFHQAVGPFTDAEGGLGHRVIGKTDVDRILDRVAGLNASESPPPEYGWHNDGDECIGPHCINMEHDDERDASAGRAVQDDGLDVERLAEAIRRTALDHYRPEASSSYAHRVAKHYAALRTAPPLHDPQEPER